MSSEEYELLVGKGYILFALARRYMRAAHAIGQWVPFTAEWERPRLIALVLGFVLLRVAAVTNWSVGLVLGAILMAPWAVGLFYILSMMFLAPLLFVEWVLWRWVQALRYDESVNVRKLSLSLLCLLLIVGVAIFSIWSEW